ncbi:unnamed protein product [Protopolystoma xenopodis]|uniref:Uncharacterized protein n=1 Tax=Protopolystoma xenopodis TaxID=117903 RepID=A0A3S5FH53_9PLAT|nr:unnamed protein product [Protopolystoma xenopodis]
MDFVDLNDVKLFNEFGKINVVKLLRYVIELVSPILSLLARIIISVHCSVDASAAVSPRDFRAALSSCLLSMLKWIFSKFHSFHSGGHVAILFHPSTHSALLPHACMPTNTQSCTQMPTSRCAIMTAIGTSFVLSTNDMSSCACTCV